MRHIFHYKMWLFYGKMQQLLQNEMSLLQNALEHTLSIKKLMNQSFETTSVITYFSFSVGETSSFHFMASFYVIFDSLSTSCY